MITITICSTRSYSYALLAQARKVSACIEREPMGVVLLVGDTSKEMRDAEAFYQQVLPEGWRAELMTGKFADGLVNYDNPAQLIIARMRSRAFDRARQLQSDLCWSLDSDVLPQANALRVMRQMLEFDDGFYSVSTCPYPSQGGGAFLGGRGTPERPILPDFYDDEREIPKDLKAKMDAHQKRWDRKGPPPKKWMAQFRELSKAVQQCKPVGNVFHCNSKGFRRRGWMHAAYPEVGIGAVVPSDWCGFGCTLMTRRALALAQFDGYDGSGTEDLYVVWKRWYRATPPIRINVIPHSPCDHVIRDRTNNRKFILCQAYHESRDAETVGHLRVEPRPWYQQTENEPFNPSNDGQLTFPKVKLHEGRPS